MNVLWGILIVFLTLIGFSRGVQARERIVPEGEPDRRAETIVVLLLLGAAACALVFIVAYVLDWPDLTQYLGLAMGTAFALMSIAMIVSSRRLVVSEDIEEDYPDPEHPEEQQKLMQVVHESGSRITRKRLLGGAAGMAAGAIGAALVVPAVSLGPLLDTESFYETPWRRGRRLVDEGGRPYRASDIEENTFYTAYPEGADREDLGSPLVVVRLPTAALHLPRDRAGWAPQGILAYSKICTHAGCAIALYRTPLFPDAGPRPALVCPCHYSTFDPARAGKVIFGPAGRNLPQLPLLVDRRGGLRAAGNFSGPVGPSFWGVRGRRPRTS